MSSPVTFLSLGPGDPEHLTLKAVRLLREADAVLAVATQTAGGEIKSRAQEIINEWVDDQKLRLYPLPMRKEREAAMTVYDQIGRDAATLQREGQRVAVAVEGDVSIYASIHYVMDRLQSDGIPVAQCPGIPSFIAAAALAGLSLISQQQRLTVLPGDADTDTLRHLLTTNHVVVIMKLSQCQQALKTFLLQSPTTLCHYFENVGSPAAFHTTDHDIILSRQIPYFSLCILYPA